MKKLIFMVLMTLLMSSCVGCDTNNTSDANNDSKTEETSESASSQQDQQDQELTLSDEEKEEFEKVKSKGRYPQLEEVKKGETVAIISTNMGDVKVRFFPEYAPKAVENFLTHAKEGYYNGVIFHRVINNFMIQGGDPEGTGMGGESIWGEPFEVEASADLKNIRGALCMAKTNQPISIGSQFFIVQNPALDEDSKSFVEEIINDADKKMYENDDAKISDIWPTPLMEEYLKSGGYPSLDFQYTVFGQVYEGMDVVDKIAGVETDEDDKPKQDVIINKIEVTEY